MPVPAPVSIVRNRGFAVFVPAVVGFGLAAGCVRGFGAYGWSLFLGLPVVVGFLSAFCWSWRREVSFGSACGVSVLSLLCLGAFILATASPGQRGVPGQG